MPECHEFEKTDLIDRFDGILGKTFGEIDNAGLFENVREFPLQKGIAGHVIEKCVLCYEPNSNQEADLIVRDGDKIIDVELKSTGLVLKDGSKKHFEAKEPMSITAVSVYDISKQEFWSSHFWKKLEHMLIVYYLYDSDKAVTAFEYKDFPVKGYEFHEFDGEDVVVLKNDWESVHDLVSTVVSRHPGPHNNEWKEAVKQDYIEVHGQLRDVLSYIDLAPKFPPRFRLKKPTVNAIIAEHFGYELEQLPGRYVSVTSIDSDCDYLTNVYSGWTVKELAKKFGIASEPGQNKSVTEAIVVAMFGGKSKKLNDIEQFQKFGLIGKTIVLNSKGGRTEDMKLFKIDFEEMTRKRIIDEDGTEREFQFEDSELYSYFADHAFLCIVFEEPEGMQNYQLEKNRFRCFRRIVFTEEFIENEVRKLWEDTREKIFNNKLVEVVEKVDGQPVLNKSGSIKSAPNFMKSRDNPVFIRGSATKSTDEYKTECVNGIKMIPQYVWIKGKTVVEMLND